MKPLTIQQRQFVDALFQTTPPMNGSEAARAAGVSVKSCRSQALKWLTKSHVKAAIDQRRTELERSIEKQAEITRDHWVKKMQAFFHSDVRRMFDTFGNPIEIPQLGDHEAAMIEGFEFCEDYTKVKQASGDTEAVPTGYTKKYKLTSKLKAMLEFGKVMGWLDESPDSSAMGQPVHLHVHFVEAPAGRRAPVVVQPSKQTPASSHVSPRVAFVHGKR